MKIFNTDQFGEKLVRKLAGRTSRRGMLAKFGLALAAAPAFPVLPISRANAQGKTRGDAARIIAEAVITARSSWTRSAGRRPGWARHLPPLPNLGARSPHANHQCTHPVAALRVGMHNGLAPLHMAASLYTAK